ETFDNVGLKRGPNYVATAVKQQSKLIVIEDVKSASTLVPTKGAVALQAPEPAQSDPVGVDISPDVYVGDVNDRTGLGGLEALEDVTMLVVPDLMSAHQRGALDAEQVKAIQLAMIAHCELMGDRV